jgi:hypothetical protein
MQRTMENKKKVTTNFPRSASKRKNNVEEGGASTLKVKKEHESTYMKAQKMMRGIMEPYVVPTMVKVVPTMVRAVPTMVQIVRQTSIVP